jgi:hypothetical protein
VSASNEKRKVRSDASKYLLRFAGHWNNRGKARKTEENRGNGNENRAAREITYLDRLFGTSTGVASYLFTKSVVTFLGLEKRRFRSKGNYFTWHALPLVSGPGNE